jgi:outer membrane biogenesis lipoprotein LolB
LLLASCGSIAPPTSLGLQSGVAADAVYMDKFVLSGRLSVRNGDRLDSVRIEWSRDESGDTMRFFSPFGNQLALVTSTPKGASLQRGDTVERADSMQSLTQSLLGVAIDPTMLAKWVQGIQLEAADRLSNGGIEPADRWAIEAENLRRVEGVHGGQVAGRILAKAGDISLRLVIDSFEPVLMAPTAKAPVQ